MPVTSTEDGLLTENATILPDLHTLGRVQYKCGANIRAVLFLCCSLVSFLGVLQNSAVLSAMGILKLLPLLRK